MVKSTNHDEHKRAARDLGIAAEAVATQGDSKSKDGVLCRQIIAKGHNDPNLVSKLGSEELKYLDTARKTCGIEYEGPKKDNYTGDGPGHTPSGPQQTSSPKWEI